jgi:hypothetical protein
MRCAFSVVSSRIRREKTFYQSASQYEKTFSQKFHIYVLFARSSHLSPSRVLPAGRYSQPIQPP